MLARSRAALWRPLVLLLAIVTLPVQAEVLGSTVLLMPLSPDMSSSASIAMGPGFDPSKPTWVAYQVFAMSANEDPEGKIVVSGSFDGEPTQPLDATVLFEPRDLRVSTSAGTLKAQVEAKVGQRSEQDMRALLGPELHDAYQAVVAGHGRMLDGIANRTLPPLAKGYPVLLVSVDRAEGIAPVGLSVTVGQGEIPPELQPNAESTGAYKLGFGLGRIAFFAMLIGFLYWLFIGRKRSA